MRQKGRGASKVKPSSANLLLASIDSKLEKMGPKLLRELKIAAIERDEAVNRLKFLTDKLVGFLTPDQIDAAKTCCIQPEMYAIHFIEIWKERIFAEFELSVMSLSKLNRNETVGPNGS